MPQISRRSFSAPAARGHRHAASDRGPGAIGQAEYIAGHILEQERKPKIGYANAAEHMRTLRQRVSLRYFTWEAPGAHSYRHGELV